MTRRNVWGVILLVSYIFIVASGLNAGPTRYAMGIPFMILAVCISYSFFKISVLLSTVFLITASLLLNINLEKNPVVFPILHNGYVEILRDAVHTAYFEGSGRLYENKFAESDQIATRKRVKKGAIYKVTGIRLSPNGLVGNNIDLETELGIVSESDYKGDEDKKQIAKTNKVVHLQIASTLSFLMYWPFLFVATFPLGIAILIVLIANFNKDFKNRSVL